MISDSFLSSLIDSSNNSFLFGKSEHAPQSIFLIQKGETNNNGKGTSEYIEIYKGHFLKPLHRDPLLRNNVTPDWFFPLIILVLGVFAWLRIFYNRYFMQMFSAFLNKNLANQIVRDENIFIQRASVYLSIVFNLIGALFLYLVSVRYKWSLGGIEYGFSRFIFFLLVVSAAYAMKFLVLKITGWLFELEKEMGIYIFNIFLINNILGIVLLPIICLIAYNETLAVFWIMMIPFILIALAFCWRIFRGIQIGLGIASFSPLNLFLYLCTLEIAPLMVLIRIIVQ